MAAEYRRSLTLTTTGLDPAVHKAWKRDEELRLISSLPIGLTDVQVQVSQVNESEHEVRVLCGSRSKTPGHERNHGFFLHGDAPAWLQVLVDAAVAEFHGMEQHGWGSGPVGSLEGVTE